MNKILPTNEHNVERALRVLIGIALLSLVFVGPKSLWGLIGAVIFFFFVMGSCEIYTLFGWSTCSVKQGPAATGS